MVCMRVCMCAGFFCNYGACRSGSGRVSLKTAPNPNPYIHIYAGFFFCNYGVCRSGSGRVSLKPALDPNPLLVLFLKLKPDSIVSQVRYP